MSKRFEQALIALIKEQGSNADVLFKSFVNEHLGVVDEPVTEATEDDMLSGDVEAEPDDTGLTEHDDEYSTPEIYLTNEQEHQDFFMKYNEWRGVKSENQENVFQIRTEGRCLAEIHCELEDQYTLQIMELGRNYYGLTTTINTAERDYYEDLGFVNDDEAQSFIKSI